MTVMVGDRSDFRSGLSEEDLETASRLSASTFVSKACCGPRLGEGSLRLCDF